VVLACDIDAPRLQSFMADYGIPEGTASFAKVLARPEVEVVDICTPPLVNRDQILAALAAGKEVICEKPLVGSLRDLDAVTQAAARAPAFQAASGGRGHGLLQMLRSPVVVLRMAGHQRQGHRTA
jgi:predicted dehydrogenase